MDELTAQEEIAFIKKVMQDSRKLVYADGKEFIYWGIIITVCLIYTYFTAGYHVTGSVNVVPLVWLFFIVLGGIGSAFFIKKRYKTARIKSLAGQVLEKIWLGNGIGMIMVAFVGGFSGAIHGVYISPLMSSFLGGSYYISGFIYGKKWVSYLAVFWWLGAAIMFIFPGLYVCLLMAAMIILLQIIPGIILYRDSKQEIAKSK
ncbi:MAG: hypothetical protein ABR980_01690 [Ignavibacteriaceae bacterium]